MKRMTLTLLVLTTLTTTCATYAQLDESVSRRRSQAEAEKKTEDEEKAPPCRWNDEEIQAQESTAQRLAKAVVQADCGCGKHHQKPERNSE